MTEDRVIVLVDMDCFYCQIEELLNPSLIGKPVAVVQYNRWRGGGILAVNYMARAKGVTRHMRGNEAREICPEIQLVQVPSTRGKANISKYREAGKRVAEVLQDFTALLERASVDEAYLDITESVKQRKEQLERVSGNLLPNTHIVGYDCVDEYLQCVYSDSFLNDSNEMLLIGGVIAEEIRAAVFEKTSYRCSAGIAHNKILAKFVCGLHKPNQQTILPTESIPILYENTGVKKLRGMGGKFGDLVTEKLQVTKMSELAQFTEPQLLSHFDSKSAKWLYNIAKGIDPEPVTVRLVSKSIGCCKKFPGKTALKSEKDVKHWLKELSLEIAARVETDTEENNRRPRQLIVNYGQLVGRKEIQNSRSQNLNCYESDKMANDSYDIIKKNCQHSDGSFHITFLGLNIGKFESISKNTTNIMDFFKNAASTSKNNINKTIMDTKSEITEKNNLPMNLFHVKSNETNGTTIGYIEENSENDDEEEINAELETITKPSSFFNNFLVKAPPKRNFDTSLVLNDLSNTDESSMDSTDRPQTPLQQETEESLNFPKENSPVLSKTQICEECKKQIPIEDVTSHTDYHFALKMVREEAHLYNQQRPQPIAPKETTKQQTKTVKTVKNTKKRKKTNSIGSITSFLVTKTNEEEHTGELCSDCNKRIKLEDVASHLDYHVAKKVHLEINDSCKNLGGKKLLQEQNLGGKKLPQEKKLGSKKLPQEKHPGIKSFFPKL